MEEVDQELKNNFKSIVEYFVKKSTFEIVCQYEEVLGQKLDENSSRGEFSSLMNVYRNSSHKADIMINFDKDINLLSSKNEYLEEIIFRFSALKNYALQILPKLDMLKAKHKAKMVFIIKSARIINLLNFGSTSSAIIKCNYTDLQNNLASIHTYFSLLEKDLPLTKKFMYEKVDYKEMEDSIKDYIIRAEDMVKDPNFKDSPIKKLEDLIKDPSNCLSGDYANNFIRNPDNLPRNIEFERTFIALVAPSLCGKTQSAFAMREMSPLYFALNESAIKPTGKSQPIYANFNSLNRMIQDLAIDDMKAIETIQNKKFAGTFEVIDIDAERLKEDENIKLREVGYSYDESNDDTLMESIEKSPKKIRTRIYKNITSIYELISADNLFSSFKNQKFFTLGFIVALMEEAEDNYDKNYNSDLIPGAKKSWMEFYSQREGERSEFYFDAISINDVLQKKNLFKKKKYFLFLDEFSGFPWAVLIRNLIRAIGMRVCVANTSSDITNLAGKSHASSSRGTGILEVWSIVVVRLNKSYLNVSDPKYISLLEKIRDIIESFEDMEKEAVRSFFEDFINDQFFKLRPGVLEFVREIILNLSVDQAQSAHYIFDTIITNLGIELAARKSRIPDTPEGILANLGLFLSNSYYDKNREPIVNSSPSSSDTGKTERSIKSDKKTEALFHKSSYLMNHLYYLENPVDNGDFMFMSFYPMEKSTHLQVYQKKTLRNWIAEFTYFDEDEMLTILGCMSILRTNSIIKNFDEGRLLSISGNVDIGSSLNMEALKHDGNRLEVLAAVSIIEASQHKFQGKYNTLLGQNCFDLACNILLNLRFDLGRFGNCRKNGIQVSNFISAQNERFDLKRFLSSIRVPFLFASNCQVPGILCKLSNFGVINVGYCERTADNTKIDFKFDIFAENGQKMVCVAECKNLCNPISSNGLIDIMQKAYDTKGCGLNLIFCNYLKDFTGNDLKLIKTASRNGQLNIFKIEKVEGIELTFNWTPISDLVYAHPKMVVLIYELNVINPLP
jgi:hypothetical protein